MKLSGQAIKVDNSDYNPNSDAASYMANNGLILISGSYDTGINNGVTNDHSDASHNYGSSAGMVKLKEAKWSSQHTIFNNGKIYVGGYNNSGILLETIYEDTVTNNGNITIDKAYNLFNNPDNSVNFSNAVAESNAGIRVQSYNTTDTAAGTDIVGINKGTININNGSGNVGIYAFDVQSGNIPSSTGHYIVGDNTNVISINGGSNVGMMAQDDSGSTTNFKTIIRNSGTINVGGKGSIGMYTNDKASFAEQNGGTITASSNNVGVVNNGTFDFKGGTIKATGVNSVGVYSKNGTNSTTTIGTGTPNSATLNVSDGGVGLYADDGSTQTLKGLNANVSGTDKVGSILLLDGVSFNYRQPVGLKSSLKASLAAAYTNELGEVNDVKNKTKLRGADAPHYELRGDKENRKGSGKFDLNLGFENTRFGVTVNAGYDTKGENVRGGIGFRAIY